MIYNVQDTWSFIKNNLIKLSLMYDLFIWLHYSYFIIFIILSFWLFSIPSDMIKKWVQLS